jgi:hypothetical protein
MKIHPTINISQLKEYHDGSDAFPTRPAPLTRPAPVVVVSIYPSFPFVHYSVQSTTFVHAHNTGLNPVLLR